ncbi:MAG: ribosome silencing factor [Lachnospiraceae bacterium]|nr:ribosome silencing factor [Lachnospiraceae bacterium]MDY4968812.1 ribosome silencing factor [Lachnospiraceae bacterium]
MSTSRDMVQTAFSALDEKLAADINVIDISQVSVVADYFIIAAGNNVNQVQAIADNVMEKMGRAGYDLRQVEGYQSARWILLDYHDVVIHVFYQEDRRFYDLERIWRDGKFIDTSEFRQEKEA